VASFNGTHDGLLCDEAGPMQASALAYSYLGLGYNGTQLVASTAGEPVLLQASGAGAGGALAITYASARESTIVAQPCPPLMSGVAN
jgi:hypothetical protein